MVPQGSKEYMNLKINAHKFQKISYSGIISFVYVGKEEILKYMGRIANQRKILNWLSFKNCMSESLNILCAYMGDICAYVYQI